MTARVNPFGAGWWRFTDYEIRGGHIQPALNASLQAYDPWEIYAQSKREIQVAPPYQVLLDLVGKIRAACGGEEQFLWFVRGEAPPPGTKPINMHTDARTGMAYLMSLRPYTVDLPDIAKAAITSWCSQFGLLGILPHVATMLRPQARWSFEFDRPELFYNRYERRNGRWLRTSYSTILLDRTGAPAPERNGELVSEGYANAETAITRISGVSIPDNCAVVGWNNAREESPKFWRQFFPNWPVGGWDHPREGWDYPLPLADGFWPFYAEPVRQFLLYGFAFEQAARIIAAGGAPVDLLNGLIEPIGISVSEAEGGRLQEKWVSPSLLCTFTKMMIQDLSAGAEILTCACCRSLFVTSAYQSLYCSQQCGWRHRKRRKRDRERASVTTSK